MMTAASWRRSPWGLCGACLTAFAAGDGLNILLPATMLPTKCAASWQNNWWPTLMEHSKQLTDDEQRVIAASKMGLIKFAKYSFWIGDQDITVTCLALLRKGISVLPNPSERSFIFNGKSLITVNGR